MAAILGSQGTGNDLRSYFQDVLFNEFAVNRKQLIETDWNNARNAFRKLYDYSWKGVNEGKGWRSKTYIGVVRQKIISMVGLLVDQYFRAGRFPFRLKPSAEVEVAMTNMDNVQRETVQSEIENFQRHIDEQLDEGNAVSEYTFMAFDLGIYGVGFQKRSRMEKTRIGGYQNVSQDANLGVWERVNKRITIPSRERVSPWEMFWDVENGLRKGQCDMQYRLISPYTLAAFKGKPFYFDDKIDLALSESNVDNYNNTGAGDQNLLNPASRTIQKRVNNIPYLECWGKAKKDKVLEFEAQLVEEGKEPTDIFGDPVKEPLENEDWIEVTISIAKNNVVRYARSYQEERPYYSIVPQMIPDEISPDSIAIATMAAEGLLNGSLRGAEDNGRLSGNVMVALKKEYIENMDELNEGFEPGTVITLNSDCEDARKAISQVVIQNVMSSYAPLIELAFRLADEDSLIPKLSQGIEVAEKRTAYEVSTLIERASKFIGMTIRSLDPFAQEHIEEIYDYDMNDPDATVDKASYKVVAEGYTMYQDEVLKGERLKQLLSLLLSDPSGQLGKRWEIDEIIQAIARSNGLAVTDFHKSAEQVLEYNNAEAQAMSKAEASEKQAQGQDSSAETASKADLQAAQAERDRAQAKKALSDANAKQREVQIKEAQAMQSILKPEQKRKPVKTGKVIEDIIEQKKPTDQILVNELAAGALVE